MVYIAVVAGGIRCPPQCSSYTIPSLSLICNRDVVIHNHWQLLISCSQLSGYLSPCVCWIERILTKRQTKKSPFSKICEKVSIHWMLYVADTVAVENTVWEAFSDPAKWSGTETSKCLLFQDEGLAMNPSNK